MANILIIEDEVALADAYAFILRHKGHTVAVAHDGEQGLVRTAECEPDVILLDLMMPKLDGLGFLRRYDVPKHDGVKVVMLSNMQSAAYESQATALGVCRYELKALLTPTQLLSIVDDLLL